MTDKDWSDFLGKVKAMRDFQKDYFRTKSYGSLTEAKRLEGEVDKMVKAIEQKGKTEAQNMQLGLFG